MPRTSRFLTVTALGLALALPLAVTAHAEAAMEGHSGHAMSATEVSSVFDATEVMARIRNSPKIALPTQITAPFWPWAKTRSNSGSIIQLSRPSVDPSSIRSSMATAISGHCRRR